MDPTDTTSVSGVLDSLFGTAASAVDVWSQWDTAKTQAQIQKAAIPATVTAPTPALPTTIFGVPAVVVYLGAGLLALVLLIVAFRPRK